MVWTCVGSGIGEWLKGVIEWVDEDSEVRSVFKRTEEVEERVLTYSYCLMELWCSGSMGGEDSVDTGSASKWSYTAEELGHWKWSER